jgi:hypothetical protein
LPTKFKMKRRFELNLGQRNFFAYQAVRTASALETPDVMPEQPIPPSTSEIAVGWRVACVAYRRVRHTGLLHGSAFEEALLALRAVPDLS